MPLTKGTSRRVIVVDSPDTGLFEQAIFILRSDVARQEGVSAQRIVDDGKVVCPSCGQRVPKNNFCRECGKPLPKVCPKCGHNAKATDRFCQECGTKLA